MNTDDAHRAPPPGFAILQRGGPFIAGLGPLYRRGEGPLVVAMRVQAGHTNMRGIAHGGMLTTLADSALGLGLSFACEDRHSFVTVNLSTDFIDAARPGDWVEAHVDVERIGARVAFASCFLQVGEKRILRASGVFAVMKPLKPEQLSSGY